MSLILVWPCKRCGLELSEKDYLITRKFCPKCKEDIKKEKYTASNRNRAILRIYTAHQTNLVKNWIYLGVKR